MRCFALLFGLLAVCSTVSAQEEFATKTIDIGMVVSDIEKSVKFYKEAIGMKESGGFSVPGDFAFEAGLSNRKQLDIRVMTLGDGEGATKLKLMQIPEVESRKPRNRFIHTTLGYSYITISVTDTNAATARLEKAGVKTLKKTPIALPAPLPTHVFLTLVRDPDGNFVELVGPKK